MLHRWWNIDCVVGEYTCVGENKTDRLTTLARSAGPWCTWPCPVLLGTNTASVQEGSLLPAACCTATHQPVYLHKKCILILRHQPRNASERTHAQHAVCSCSAPWSPAAPAHWLPLPDDMLPLQSGSPTQHPPTQATLFASTQALHQLTVQPPYNNYATVHAWTHTYTHTCEHTSNRI